MLITSALMYLFFRHWLTSRLVWQQWTHAIREKSFQHTSIPLQAWNSTTVYKSVDGCAVNPVNQHSQKAHPLQHGNVSMEPIFKWGPSDWNKRVLHTQFSGACVDLH